MKNLFPIKKIISTLGFVGMVATFGSVGAKEPLQQAKAPNLDPALGQLLGTMKENLPLVGSWCVTFKTDPFAPPSLHVPLIYNFSADGNITVANGNNLPLGPAGEIPARSTGLGEFEKTGENEWESNYQYFDSRDGTVFRRFVVKSTIVYDPQTDTISNGPDNAILTFVNNNLVIPPLNIQGDLMGTRIDKDNPILCDLPDTSF